jgi:1,4-dihydroxy-2-naphthoyl-CoA hydrolase
VSQPPPTPIELGRTLDGTLGVEWIEASAEAARARIPVTDKLKQPMGLVHGGVFAALAESLASAATYMAVREDGMVAMGMSNQTTFMRPITEGTIHGEARRRHRGRTTWLWDVEITDDDGRLCALARVTMAVRPARPG